MSQLPTKFRNLLMVNLITLTDHILIHFPHRADPLPSILNIISLSFTVYFQLVHKLWGGNRLGTPLTSNKPNNLILRKLTLPFIKTTLRVCHNNINSCTVFIKQSTCFLYMASSTGCVEVSCRLDQWF